MLNNPTLFSLYSEAEKNASGISQYNLGNTTGLTDGNTSGVSWVLNNLSQYNLYTEGEKNASDMIQNTAGKTAGFIDGNTSGVSLVLSNPTLFSLYTEAERNKSESNQYSNGVAEIQASLAKGGMVSSYYLENLDLNRPYTSQWFYQPGLGWLWTSRESFPFIYRAEDITNGISSGWLYLNQTEGQGKINLYDYGNASWMKYDF